MRSLKSLLLLLGTLSARVHFSEAQKPPVDVVVPEHPPDSALANVVDDNFLGISWELSSFASLWGDSPDTLPYSMTNYLHNLVARMSHPLRIRVGGNGMDGSTYDPDLDHHLSETDPEAYFNDIPVVFGPVFFDVMNAMYDRVGPMEFMIGLSMRWPDSDNVITLAQAAQEKLGDRLDAMLLGNEPDLYAGHGERDEYEIEDYIPEIDHMLNRLENEANVNSSQVMAGPTICCGWTLEDLFNAGYDDFDWKYYTIQRYPNHACQGPTDRNTNITYYTNHTNVGPYLDWNRVGISRAIDAGVPVLLTEYNSVACGGSNISATFAMSMWSIDVALKAASMNYSAVFLHTREHGITYNLFDPPTPETSRESGWRTGSPYYGALFISETFSPNGNIVIDLDIDSSTTNINATTAGYAIYDRDGDHPSKLAFLNFDREETQPFTIPAGLADTLYYRVLTAPSIFEERDIRWAGQTVGPSGNLEGDQTLETLDCRDGCTFELQGPGVALISLEEDTFYVGNSTLASVEGFLNDGSGAVATGPSSVVLSALAALGAAFWL
ncbi:hypothetical protein AX16_005744 [Volvariella volvacea WC 439]|nr:hypothetical protein AX16_005744 [Volvariella volvacea WC 439]